MRSASSSGSPPPVGPASCAYRKIYTSTPREVEKTSPHTPTNLSNSRRRSASPGRTLPSAGAGSERLWNPQSTTTATTTTPGHNRPRLRPPRCLLCSCYRNPPCPPPLRRRQFRRVFVFSVSIAARSLRLARMTDESQQRRAGAPCGGHPSRLLRSKASRAVLDHLLDART